MIARITLLKKRADLTQADFLEHWLGSHMSIARKLPGLRGLVAFSPQGSPLASCDGLGMTWFDSHSAADAAFADENIRRLLGEDRPKFVAEVQSFLAEEHVVLPIRRAALQE